MRDVLAEFRESDVVIRVCQKENSKALKWLITMDINPFVSDSNGMTSLMYAAKQKSLYFFVEHLIKGDGNEEELVNIVDKNGENALFHAINVPIIFELLLKTKIDVNHKNNNQETVLHLSLRNNLSSNLECLFVHPDVDLRIADKEGKTPIMKLLEQENYSVLINTLRILRGKARISPDSVKLDINYRSKVSNESIMSILIKKYYQMCCKNNYREVISGKMDMITALGYVLGLVISYPGFDVNMPIDEIDNTPIMFFLMIGDFVVANFIFSCCKDVDLGKKNKNGINASVLATKINDILFDSFLNHKTFDKHFVDSNNNNLLVYSVLFNSLSSYLKLINDNPKLIEQVNNKQENSIIIGVKQGFLEQVNSYVIRNANFNQQDYLGNSALFYAVKLKSKYDVNLLAHYHADPNLKNNQGMSPMDLAKQMGEEKLQKLMRKSKPIHEMKKKLKSSKHEGLFKSKSSSDEKLEEYIKNYQINNFSEDYKEIMENSITYPYTNERSKGTDEQLAITLYVTLDYCDYCPMISVDAKGALEKRKTEYKHHSRRLNKPFFVFSNDNIDEVIMYKSYYL
ncbi:hypothetical protein PIROE2DRAFT_17429 [Piromyces sp. E2]|nr:hypothetical protein PIROE2DRAFT_17429 [Piromyces sp. E2]|eukprot:OUM57553.1 hypothetical protein PIROE2DRAFT_17429 [Piromyces sp. E2]